MAADTYTVERSVTIAAAPEPVFAQIADFHHWTAWSPWEGLDPQLRRSYSGAAAGTGAEYGWSGNRKAGRGRMEIVEAVAPSLVRIGLVFERPFKSRSVSVFSLRPEGVETVVTWTLTGDATLMTKLMGIFTSMDKLLGPDFERGLGRLKTTVEQPTTGV